MVTSQITYFVTNNINVVTEVTTSQSQGHHGILERCFIAVWGWSLKLVTNTYITKALSQNQVITRTWSQLVTAAALDTTVMDHQLNDSHRILQKVYFYTSNTIKAKCTNFTVLAN